MKINKIILTTVLTVAMALPLSAQQPHTEYSGKTTTVSNLAGAIETSTVVATVDGPHMKLWLMTRKAGVVITRNGRGNLVGPTGGTRPIPADRYLIMLEVTDTTILKRIDNASATVLVVSPSDENNSMEFKAANGGFGCPLTLAEKGEYRFTVNVSAGRQSRLAQFRYVVK